MGWKIGAPSLKLNNAGVTSKHCGDFGAVAREALEEREGHDPDIKKEMADQNQFEGFRTAKELQEYSEKHVAQLRDAKGRKLRKDAVVMCATILKPPAAMMNRLSQEDQARFLDDAYEAFTGIVGREKVKSRADHYDELGAHSHVFWEPMTSDGRLCAKEVHNLQFFGRVNRELPQKLRERGWDIEDCECYDAAKEQYEAIQKNNGRDSMTFKVEAEKKKAELEMENNLLKGFIQDAKDEIQALNEEKAAEIAKAKQEAVEAADKAAQERMAALQAPEEVLQIQGKKSLGGGKVTYTSETSQILERYARESANVLMRNQDLEEQLDTTAAELVRTQQALKDLRGELYTVRFKYAEAEHQRKSLAKELKTYKAQVEKFLEQFKLAEQFKAWIQKMTRAITRN